MTDQAAPATGTGRISLRGATFLGVGSMVGAGIFALLGQAAEVAGGATWLSFLLSGLLTALLGYCVVHLGARYPSSGGFIEYLRQGFGNGHLLGFASWLGYFALIIVSAMVAVSFGDYAGSLFFGDDASEQTTKLLAAAIVILMTAVNVRGSGFVDKAQSAIVVIVLGVFAVFVLSAFTEFQSANLDPADYPAFVDIVGSVALTFFAYLGFAVITFSAGDLANPARDLRRATYLAIGIATTTYVLISLGVFGVLGTDEVIANGSTAIAEAARPVLGDAGFTLISIAAMFATAGCANANLYGATHLTEMLGTIGQFPPTFARDTKRGRPAGLMITALLVLVMALLFDVGSIASIGTVVALCIFVMLCVAGIRLRSETGAKIAPMLLAIFSIVLVLSVFVIDTLRSDPNLAVVMLAVVVIAAGCEWAWKRREAQQRAHGRAAGV